MKSSVFLNDLLVTATITDKSADTFEQNKRFLSAFFRNFKKHLFCR